MKVEPPRFSVVIPLFNKKQYISKTIQSVLRQTFSDFELIVINDGSTDGSAKEVEKFNDPRIKLISTRNQGVAAARNVGLNAAKGTYIAFLDADDLWKKDYLFLQNGNIEQYPDAGFYCSRYVICRSDKKELSSSINSDGKIGTFWQLLKEKYDIVWTSATVIKREYVEAAGLFNPDDQVGEDLGLWARVARTNADVVYLGAPEVIYNRSTQNNARARTKILYPSDFLKIINEEILSWKHSANEIEAMIYKRDKKMYVYILSLLVNKEKRRAKEELNRWHNQNFGLYKTALQIMLYLPTSINREIYRLAIRNT